jgi:hypothetical protein
MAAQEALAPARAVAQKRMSAALALLMSDPEVRAMILQGEQRAAQAAELTRALDALAESAERIARLSEEHTVVQMLISARARTPEEAQSMYNQANMRMEPLVIELAKLLRPLEGAPYAFEHARGKRSLAAFLTDDIPEHDNAVAGFVRLGHVMARLHAFHSRALGRLAAVAEEVERAVGLSDAT